MAKKKRKKPSQEEIYLKVQKKLNRDIELERNGGRWIAVNRSHKSVRDYNRKREKHVDLDDFSLFSLH